MPQLRACALLVALTATLSWPGAYGFRNVKSRKDTSTSQVDATHASSGELAGRRRRRRTCGGISDFPTHRGDTVECSSAEPRACDPPKYYTIRRHADDRLTNLGTYSTEEAARAVYDQGGWQVRVLLDETQTVVSRQDNCGRSYEFQDWAVGKLTNVHYCDYPYGQWSFLFAIQNPRADWSRTETTSIGRSFTVNTTLTYKQKFSTSIGIGPFSSSAKYKIVTQIATSETWEDSYTLTEQWNGSAGVPVVKWKYVLMSKCFNEEGQFLDEVEFATNIFCDTEDMTQPSDDVLDCPTVAARVGRGNFIPLQALAAESD